MENSRTEIQSLNNEVSFSEREESAKQLLSDIREKLKNKSTSKNLEDRITKLKNQCSGITDYECLEILADYAEDELKELGCRKKKSSIIDRLRNIF